MIAVDFNVVDLKVLIVVVNPKNVSILSKHLNVIQEVGDIKVDPEINFEADRNFGKRIGLSFEEDFETRVSENRVIKVLNITINFKDVNSYVDNHSLKINIVNTIKNVKIYVSFKKVIEVVKTT